MWSDSRMAGPIECDYLDRDPGMAACQPKVLAHGQPEAISSMQGLRVVSSIATVIRSAAGGSSRSPKRTLGSTMMKGVFWATGACLLIRAAAFHEAGGFDAALFAHMEEIDLCWRLRRMGWRIGYTSQAWYTTWAVDPWAIVRHIRPTSISATA
jgi:GT2 family glycosyltransferase